RNLQFMSFDWLNKHFLGKFLLLTLGAGVVVYALTVLVYVSSSSDLGIRSMLTPAIIGMPAHAEAVDTKPITGDLVVVQAGDERIGTWSDLLDAPRSLHRKVVEGQATSEWYHHNSETEQDFVTVICRDALGVEHTFRCELKRFPLEDLIPSLIWLCLKGALF